MPGDRDDDGFAGRNLACSVLLDQARDTGSGTGLYEHAFLCGKPSVGGQDLVIGDSLNQPPDSSRAATAVSHEAGLPMRMAVAIVSGSVMGCPATNGAAPAAWKPHMTGVLVETAGSVPLAVSNGAEYSL